ncbi:hypothetical protein ACFVHB_03690 [Kitasatospora sp. NPDC127111]|uniref:hypothetical protein n=1 Tax=Kitasatospora sp. NPDC127111 TaxID=3345363 RepID=UPI0036285982
MKKIIVTGMLALAGASLAVPAHAAGGSAVPGVESLPLNNLANAGKDPLNSNVASDGGASGLAGLSNLDTLTALVSGLLKGAAISGAHPTADASGEGAGGSSRGSASPLSSLTGGGDKGSPLSSLSGGLNG